MAKVDNDETKMKAQPFIIIAQRRSGGTFLAHALSSHIDIFCDRGETLHHMGIWRRRMALPKLIFSMMNQEGYKASGFRAVYVQAFADKTWPHICGENPRVIWLTRANKLRQGASIALNKQIRRGRVPYYPVHTFKDASKRPVPKYTIAPEAIIRECREVSAQDKQWAGKRLRNSKLKVLTIHYHELTGGEGVTRTAVIKPAAVKLCKFLGVPYAPLRTRLKRVHQHPLRAMFKNWPEIEGTIKGTEFAKFLAAEEEWEWRGNRWAIKGGENA